MKAINRSMQVLLLATDGDDVQQGRKASITSGSQII